VADRHVETHVTDAGTVGFVYVTELVSFRSADGRWLPERPFTELSRTDALSLANARLRAAARLAVWRRES
jgi:hypothetical protein